MPLLKRVARHGGTPWEQSIYTNRELLAGENDEAQLDQDDLEETCALFISRALDEIGIDHEIYGGFDTVDYSFFDDWQNAVNNGIVEFVAADSNLMLSDFGPAADGTIGGNVAEAAAEDVVEMLDDVPSWSRFGGADWDDAINKQLAAIGKNMGFAENPDQSPGMGVTCGCVWTISPLMHGISDDFTNICGNESSGRPDCTFISTTYRHTYEQCTADHMQIVDKAPLTTTNLEAGGCATAFAGPCSTAEIGPDDGGDDEPPGDDPPSDQGGTDIIVLALLGIIIFLALTRSN